MTFTEIELGGQSDIEVLVLDFAFVKKGLVPATFLESVQWVLNGVGKASLSMPSKVSAASLLLEGQREIRIAFKDYLRTDVGTAEMWQGTVIASSGEPGTKSFECDSLEGWLWDRPLENTSLIYAGVDQFDIGWDLVNRAQTGSNMALGFTASYGTWGVLQYLEANMDEHPYYGDLLQELVDLNNGFDWEIYVDQTGLRRWVPYYPRRGVTHTNIKFEFETDNSGSKNIEKFDMSTSTSEMATAAIATGGSVASQKIEGLYEDAVASAAYRRRVKVFSSGSTVTSSVLVSEATKFVNRRKQPIIAFSTTVNNRILKSDGTWDYLLGKIHVGDYCMVRIDDGANQVNGQYRIYSIIWNKDETLEIEWMHPEGAI